MRFEDWDVLLFPLGSSVPIKEFGLSYFNVPNGNHDLESTSLLACFVPALNYGAPYSVSVHCWIRQTPLVGKYPGVDTVDEVWQVEVTANGVCVVTTTFGADTQWPRVIDSQTIPGESGQKLLFPQFSATMLSQHTWDPREVLGRVQVEITAGYMQKPQADGAPRYIPLEKVVCYSFHPAPFEFLKRCGIAWPNGSIRPFTYPNPFLSMQARQLALQPPIVAHTPANDRALDALNRPMQKPQELLTEQRPATLAPACQIPKGPSAGHAVHNIAGGQLPTVPYPTPVVGGAYKFHAPHEVRDPLELPDGSSRCTSSYSAYDLEVLSAPYTNDHIVQDAAKKQQVHIRLPSDQIRQIIDAVTPPKENAVPPNTPSSGPTTMLPPPLPSQVLRSNHNGDPHIFGAQAEIARRIQSAVNTHLVDNRKQDRSSDTSMHEGCNFYPTCISEDAIGRLVHNRPPSPMVRGRKEGAVPAQARDILSTSMGGGSLIPAAGPRLLPPPTFLQTLVPSNVRSSSPANLATGKKRTRSALKGLAIGDGSPERKIVKLPTKKPLRKKSVSESSTDVDKNDGQDKDEMVLDA